MMGCSVPVLDVIVQPSAALNTKLFADSAAAALADGLFGWLFKATTNHCWRETTLNNW